MQNMLTTADIHNISTQHFLQDINLDVETYMDALKIQKEVQMSFWYMHAIMTFYLYGEENVDLQYVINEIATVKYMCSYMMKGEKGISETLKGVAKECWNDVIHTQMNKIKKEFLGKQVFGCTRISNVGVVNVADAEMQESCMTDNKYERWMCKSTKTTVTTSTATWWWWRCFATSLIDRYAASPVSLQNMCLATFAVTYDAIQSATKTEETGGINDTEEEMQNTGNDNSVTRMKLWKGLGIIRKRKPEAILWTSRYKIHTKPEKYYHAKLLLYYPWNMRMTP